MHLTPGPPTELACPSEAWGSGPSGEINVATDSQTGAAPVLRPGFADSLQRLSGAQKSGKGAPAYSLFVNRRLGRVLAAGAHVLSLTPNTVTAISAAFTFTAIAMLAIAPPVWSTGAAVSLLLVLGYGLDAADGQLARLRGGGSLAGEWLDHMFDSLKSTSLHLAVLIGAYRFGDLPDVWLLVPIGFVVVDASSFFAQILNEQLRRNRVLAPEPSAEAATRPSLTASMLKVPTDYGVLCLSFLLLGSGEPFAVVYTCLFLASAAYLALAMPKWCREMQTLDVAGGTGS